MYPIPLHLNIKHIIAGENNRFSAELLGFKEIKQAYSERFRNQIKGHPTWNIWALLYAHILLLAPGWGQTMTDTCRLSVRKWLVKKSFCQHVSNPTVMKIQQVFSGKNSANGKCVYRDNALTEWPYVILISRGKTKQTKKTPVINAGLQVKSLTSVLRKIMFFDMIRLATHSLRLHLEWDKSAFCRTPNHYRTWPGQS